MNTTVCVSMIYQLSAAHLLSLYNTLRVFGVAPSACELYEEEVLVAHRDAAVTPR